MNLQGIAAPFARAVTPAIPANLFLATGEVVTAADGSRTPRYQTKIGVLADVQAASSGDLRQLDGLNIQGVERVAYLSGDVSGLNRTRGKGGDLLVFQSAPGIPASLLGPKGTGTWLVAAVLETWDSPGWCKVALTMQVATPLDVNTP